MNKILLIALFCMILLVGTISAYEFDDVKNVKETIGKAGYEDLEIQNAFGLGKVLWSGTMDVNTEVCAEDCFAYQTIELFEKGSLIDDIKFITILRNGSRVEEPIKKYQIYYRLKENSEWIKYDLASLKPKGVYEVKLYGKKEAVKKVDWIYLKRGGMFSEYIELSEWADWTPGLNVGLIAYWSADTVESDNKNGVLIDGRTGVANATNVSATIPPGIQGVLLNATKGGVGVWGWHDLTVPNHFNMTKGNFSMNFWFNASNVAGTPLIFSSTLPGNTFSLQFTVGAIRLTLTGEPDTTAGFKPSTNKTYMWTIVANESNSSAKDIYVDGVFNETLTNAGTLDLKGMMESTFGSGEFLSMLGFSDGTTDRFEGWTDEIGIWNRSLTASEITQLYGGGTPPSQVNLFNLTATQLFPSNDTNTTDTTVSLGCEFNRSLTTLSNITEIEVNVYNKTDGALEFTNTTTGLNIQNLTEEWTTSALTVNNSYVWNCYGLAIDGGNATSTNLTFNIRRVVINDQIFNNNTIEGSSEDFLLNVTLASGLTITESTFIYDGNSSTAQALPSDGNIIIERLGFVIPNVGPQTNKSFNWILNLSDSSTVITEDTNQTVNNISVSDCSVLTNNILNFTLVDEEAQTLLTDNITMETAINIFSIDRSVAISNFSNNFSNSTIAICLSTSLLNNTNYSLDAIVKYEAQGYATEYYNIVNFILSNTSGFQNITLYDLNESDSTEFRLSFTGTDFLPAENVLVFVERQYLAENTFKTVELPLTDTNGQTILHLVRNDILYNLIFMRDGVVLRIHRNLRAFCEDITIGACTISLNALSEEGAVINYDEEIGIIFENPPTYNETTNRISFAYTSSDSSVKDVVMRVERRDIFGNNSICNNSLSSVSGVLSCNIGSGITDTTLSTTISVNGNDKIMSEVIIDSTAYGSFGYVAWFFLTLGLILVFSKDKNGVLIALLMSYIGAVGMGIILGGVIGIGSAGIWIIIITMIGIWRLNKNKLD